MLQTMDEYNRRTPNFAYFGDRGDWYIAHTAANCSDIVTRANHEAIKEALPAGSFTVETFGGPLRGVHGEWILIDPARQDAIDTALAILAGLDDYPVVNDEVLSRLEWDEAHDAAAQACDIDSACAEAAAPFIVNYALEDDGRDLFDFWPTPREVFFGYLRFRRAARAAVHAMEREPHPHGATCAQRFAPAAECDCGEADAQLGLS